MEKRILFARRLGLTAITNLLITLSGIILLPILTKTLSTADYGSWSLILVTIGLAPNIVTLGLQFSVIRFLPALRDKREIQELFYSIGFVILVTSSIASGLFFLFANQIAASFLQGDLIVALLLVPSIFLACLTAFLPNYFRALQQMKRYSALSLFQAYANVGLIAFFIFSGYGLRGAVTGLLIQQLLVFCVSAYLILRAIGVVIPSLANIRTYIGFGLPLVLSSVSTWTVNSSDRYLIGIFLGTVAVGYYSPAYSLGSAIALLSQPFVVMLLPALSRHYEENSLDDVRMIMKYSLKYYSGIAIPSFFALSILAKPLLVVLSTQAIATNGYLVTPFVAAATLLVGAYEVLVQGIALKKKTARIGSIWLISAAVNFSLNLVLIPYLGIIGAAVTTLLAFACAFVLTTVYSLRYFKFDVNGSFILKSVGASIALSAILLLWNPAGLLDILLSIGFSAAIYLGILLVLKGITIDEIKFFYCALVGS
jgi:O-antigen/teichoic acid export membrane protein